MFKPIVENSLAEYKERMEFITTNQDKSRVSVLEIRNMEKDLTEIETIESLSLDLVYCSGDLLTNCISETEVLTFIRESSRILSTSGKLFISYRDYFRKISQDDRFVPVQLNPDRLITQILDYYPDHVKISKLMYDKIPFGGWAQQVESHIKLRIPEGFILDAIVKSGLEIQQFRNEKSIVSVMGAKY